MKIFYSWQSDSPSQTNRNFIRQAIDDALKAINQSDNSQVEEAVRDEATKDVLGMVDISATLLEKISGSNVYVADLTPVARTPDGKPIPNPNVMYETGWASHKPGYKFIIGVMNKHDNNGPSDLPFDLRGRLVATYDLPPQPDQKTRERVYKKLVDDLEHILRQHISTARQKQSDALQIAASPSEEGLPSLWPGGKEFTLDTGMQGRLRVHIEWGVLAYARIIPASWPDDTPPSAVAIENATPSVDPLPTRSSVGTWGTTTDGFVRLWYPGSADTHLTSRCVSMYLEEGGEYWIVNGEIASHGAKGTTVATRQILLAWFRPLMSALQLFDGLQASPRRRIIVGVAGLRDAYMAGYPIGYPVPQARKDSILEERQEAAWDRAKLEAFLRKAYDKLLAAFSQPPVTDEEFKGILPKN